MERRFSRFHPLVSFLYYAGLITLVFFMLHPIFLGLGLFMILIMNYLHDQLNGVRRWFILLLTSVFFLMILNPLFNERGRHVLFLVGQHRFTLEAVVMGGMNAVSIISVIAIFISYNVVVTPNKLLFLFSKILPQTAVLLMLTLRFIPLMRRRLDEISLVQKSKGISVHHGPWVKKVKTGLTHVQALLTYSLEEAIQTADSMKARGYGSGRNRTTYEFFKFTKTDALAIGYLGILFAVICTGRALGLGVLSVYPFMESWHLSTPEMLILSAYLFYLCFPIFVEAGEWWRWHISN